RVPPRSSATSSGSASSACRRRGEGDPMDLEPSDDQLALQTELRRFLAERVDSEARRAIGRQPGAVDRELWRDLARMGVFALVVPEAAGGAGLGRADAALVFEELGRAAVPGPLVGTFVAATLGHDIATAAAAGDAVVGLQPGGAAAPAPTVVEHLAARDALLVVDPAAVRLVDVPPGGRPVERPLDPLTPVHLLDGPAEEVLAGGHAVGSDEVADRVRRDAALLAAAFQVGLGAAAVDLAAAHAREREQFGRVIGSFQAVKHLLADAYVSLEVARSAVLAAGVAIDEADQAGRAPHGDDAGGFGAGDGAAVTRTVD